MAPKIREIGKHPVHAEPEIGEKFFLRGGCAFGQLVGAEGPRMDGQPQSMCRRHKAAVTPVFG